MRIQEVKLYHFDELSDEAKEKAVSELYDINVDYDWWQFIYDDAENIDLKLTGFNLDRSQYCEGSFIGYPLDTAKKIIAEHGEECETYQATMEYLPQLESDNEEIREKAEEEYLKAILEDYSIMLQKQYEYNISMDAVIETIKANEYEFTVDGKLF